MSDAQAKWPSDWPMRPLEKIAFHITSGGTPTSGSPRYYVEYGGLPFAKTEDLTQAKSKFVERCDLEVSEAALRETAAKRYPAGTILVSMYGTIGLTKIAARDMAANQALCALIPPLACDANYLYHHLGYIRPEWLKFSGQTTQANINGATVRAREVPLPGVNEQREISRVLDTLDTAIHETEAIIAKLKAVKQGLLHDLMTRGIDAKGELRPPQAEAPALYKPSPLGWIPAEWDVKRFEDLAEYFNGNTFDAQSWTDAGLPIIRIQNLNGSDAFNYFAGKVDERWRVLPGDLLFAWAGQRGISFGARLWEGPEGALNQHIFKVVPRGNIVSKSFLYRLLRFRQTEIEDAAHGFKDSFLHVTRGELGQVFAGVPSLQEQTAIEERIAAFESKTLGEDASLRKLRYLKAGLVEDLLTGRVRVTPLLAEAQDQGASA